VKLRPGNSKEVERRDRLPALQGAEGSFVDNGSTAPRGKVGTPRPVGGRGKTREENLEGVPHRPMKRGQTCRRQELDLFICKKYLQDEGGL